MSNIFAEFSDEPIIQEKPTGVKVLNKFPSLTNAPYRIAIIGEAPGRDEELQGQPFVGMSGKLLTGLLTKAKILREAVFIGNVCQHRPDDNKIENFSRQGVEIQEGLSQLKSDLDAFQPNICVLLGKTALWSAVGHDKIGDYRGSLFISNVIGPFLGRKCIASYHPAAVLRQYDWIAYLWFDLLKALTEGSRPELLLPERELIINPTVDDVVSFLSKLDSIEVGTDIEGYWNNLQCCSFADSPLHSMIVPFQNLDGTSYWKTEDEEFRVWEAFVTVLSNSKIPKIWQNGLYDRFVLQYGYNITVCGNYDDIMLAWWEKYCELEKGLGVQTSILTAEPHYKFERKSGDKENFFRYCCKDGAVTKEIKDKILKKLDPKQLNHYQLNVALLNPILYMELRGIKYDKALAQKRLEEVNSHIYTHQARLDGLAGVGCEFGSRQISEKSKPNIFDSFSDGSVKTTEAYFQNNKEIIKAKVRETCCYKRDGTTPKKEFAEDFYKVMLILNNSTPLTEQEIGYINTICGWSMNVKGAEFKKYLYDTLKLPKQYHPITKALTTDYISLLKIQKKQPHLVVELALEIGEMRTRSQMLEISADKDGRVRCGYNIVGTETGRLTCYTSPTGSGYNLQTIPNDNNLKPKNHPLHQGLRDLFIADDNHYLFQCDLAGADGWTVGAHLAALGDPTMLDDLRAKLKPAAVICYMFRHGNHSLQGKSRDEIKELLKEVKKEDYDYFACKQGIWGTCYLMGAMKLADVILIQSEGKVLLSKADVTSFQNAVFARYNVRLWHRWMANQLSKRPELVNSFGHHRRFWGRSTEILGQALANEPQEVTTYVTKLALHNMWNDPENRDGLKLKVEPLHTVHDSLISQSKKELKDWTIIKLNQWFDNEITVAGIRLKIPFSGEIGNNWGFTGEHFNI